MNTLMRSLSNSRFNASYWLSKIGTPSRGIQDDAIVALRNMGYRGTIDDMLRAFYMNLTGVSNVMDARSKALQLPDITTVIDFVGKVRGDGDNSRIMKYGAYTSMMYPSGFTSEVGGGYAGAAVENDASTASWASSVPVGTICQLCAFFNFTAQGTVAANLQNFRELKVYTNVVNSSVKVFNQGIGEWEDHFTAAGTQATTIELIGGLVDYLGTDNTVKIGILANVVADGTISSKAEMDFMKVTIKSLK